MFFGLNCKRNYNDTNNEVCEVTFLKKVSFIIHFVCNEMESFTRTLHFIIKNK